MRETSNWHLISKCALINQLPAVQQKVEQLKVDQQKVEQLKIDQ